MQYASCPSGKIRHRMSVLPGAQKDMLARRIAYTNNHRPCWIAYIECHHAPTAGDEKRIIYYQHPSGLLVSKGNGVN